MALPDSTTLTSESCTNAQLLTILKELIEALEALDARVTDLEEA